MTASSALHTAAEPGAMARDLRTVDRCAAVIPAFNEALTIADLVRRVRAQLPDVIVIDDGSTDATATELATLDVQLVSHRHNRGKGTSLLDGLAAAREGGFEAAVTLDADGQHRPSDIALLLCHAGPHRLVIGSRMAEAARMPRGRRIGNRIASFFISWAAGTRITDSQSGFRVYPTALLDLLDFPRRRHGFVFESEVLIEAGRHGFDIVEVPIPAIYAERPPRRSYYRPVIDTAAITCMVTGKILARGLDLAGLVRALRKRPATTTLEANK